MTGNPSCCATRLVHPIPYILPHNGIMGKKRYQNIPLRAPWWDYARDSAYFVTICTNQRRRYFGNIIQGKMIPSQVGTMATTCWHEIKNHATNVRLGEFVLMPDHVHGILVLEGNREFLENQSFNPISWQLHPRFRNPGKNNVSSIIGSYKSAVTKQAHRMGHQSFAWQSKFHDHIIRSMDEYERITTYIRNNPMNWPSDRFRR